jgi:polyhydroxybutyrate depolymerase
VRIHLIALVALSASAAFVACGDSGNGEPGGTLDADAGAGNGTSSGLASSSSSSSSSGASGSTSSSGGASSGATSSGGGSGDAGGEGGGSSSGTIPPPCGGAGVVGGFVGSQMISVGGQSRTFQLYLPSGYDGHTTYPILQVFHGDGGNGAGVRGAFAIEAASGGNAIIAYPDGQSATWQIDTYAPMMKDVAFVDAIFASLSTKYCSDGRNFLAGFSRGAYFVNQAACRTKSTLRGIMSNSGGGPYGVQSSEFANGKVVCPAARVAAMQVHGTADGTVALSEGQTTRDYWRGASACAATTSAYAPSPCVSYDGCAKAEIWCQISGMGHSVWAQSPQAAWGFFSSL